jgi:cytochrome o ubiquinol oxidase operon protein cyoD
MSRTKDFNQASYGSLKTYLAGYVLSLALTGTAFWLVHKHVLSHHAHPTDTFMFWALSALALVQLFVQLIFFLHLDRESKPRWNNVALAFAVIFVVIVVGGSIWIMTNLGYHHEGFGKTHDGHTLTSPSQTTQYIIKDEGVQP